MKTNMLLNILIGFLFTSCVAQNDRIENVIMDCSFQSFPDKGKAFKTLIVDYENLLINEKILADKSGKSYRQVLQNIADGNEFDKVPSKFFSAESQKLGKPDFEKAQECKKTIIKDSASYNMSKLEGIEQAITNAQNSNDLQLSVIAKDILKVLTEEDFEIDFYKFRVFFLFEIINPDIGINRKLPEANPMDKRYNLDKALNVYLNSQNDVFVNDKKVTLIELKKQIIKYESKFKSESVIVLKAERETMYKEYIAVQNTLINAISSLRDKLANEKYNTAFDRLDKIKTKEIKAIYPLNVVE